MLHSTLICHKLDAVGTTLFMGVHMNLHQSECAGIFNKSLPSHNRSASVESHEENHKLLFLIWTNPNKSKETWWKNLHFCLQNLDFRRRGLVMRGL